MAPSIPLGIRQNTVWALLGNATYAACQWAVLVVLAKLVPPEEMGRFALALAVTAPVFLLAGLQLRAVHVADPTERYGFGTYLRLRLALSGLALAFVLLLVWCGLASGPTAGVVLVVALAKAMETVSDIIFGLLQRRERMDRIFVSMTVKGILSLLAVGGVVRATGSVFWGSVALAATWGLVLATYDWPSARWALAFPPVAPRVGSAPAESRDAVALAKTAVPLGLVALVLSLNANIPRYFLQHVLGEREVALFSAWVYVVVAVNTVVVSFAQAAAPRLARSFAEDERGDFTRLFTRLAAMAACLGVGGVLVALFGGGPVLTKLYSAEYAASPWAFLWVTVAGAAQYLGTVLGYAVTATRWFKGQLYIHAAAMVAVTFLSYSLVGPWGVTGAAAALAVTSSLTTVAFGTVLCRLLRDRRSAAAKAEAGVCA